MSSFSRIFHDLKLDGEVVNPRGQKTLELTNYLAALEPYERFANFPSRKLSLPYIRAELLWYLRGDKADLSICDKAKLWREMVTPDGTLNSNYGAYVFKEGQLDYVTSCLLKDRASRRAVITILGKDHLSLANTDVPCTATLGFLIRGNELRCTVTMRSCDAVFGLSNDVPFFSFVQEAVLMGVNDKLTHKLSLGNLAVFMNSLHVYERHFELLDKLLEEQAVAVPCPRLSGKFEVDLLRLGVLPKDLHRHPFTAWLRDTDISTGATP